MPTCGYSDRPRPETRTEIKTRRLSNRRRRHIQEFRRRGCQPASFPGRSQSGPPRQATPGSERSTSKSRCPSLLEASTRACVTRPAPEHQFFAPESRHSSASRVATTPWGGPAAQTPQRRSTSAPGLGSRFAPSSDRIASASACASTKATQTRGLIEEQRGQQLKSAVRRTLPG